MQRAVQYAHKAQAHEARNSRSSSVVFMVEEVNHHVRRSTHNQPWGNNRKKKMSRLKGKRKIRIGHQPVVWCVCVAAVYAAQVIELCTFSRPLKHFQTTNDDEKKTKKQFDIIIGASKMKLANEKRASYYHQATTNRHLYLKTTDKIS